MKLIFVNNTKRERKVLISVADKPRHEIGRVSARGGKLHYDLIVPRRLIPAKITWRSRDRKGSFVVTARSPDRERIDIGKRRKPPPRGKRDRKDRKREEKWDEWEDD